MVNYAVINNNIVENIIVADSLETAETTTGFTCVEYTSENPAYVGWVYNNDTKKFTPPVEESTND